VVNVTIDGKKVKAKDGKSILTVAREHGIEIPTLCCHEALEPWGGCRLCTVEITTKDKRKRLVTSCNYQVEDGLVINTKAESAVAVRKMVIKLLLARCPNVKILKEMALKLGIEDTPFTKIENEVCILCGLCVRACHEVVGAHAITFVSKGIDKKVSTPYSKPSGDCIGCGACVYVCPAQCISMKDVEEASDYYADEKEKLGYARLVQNWKVRLKLQECRVCGNPFAPEVQLKILQERSKTSEKPIDTCPTCR
jgi:NADH dehydrogenase/NADH:ubiquinone oxidoreductase subunit G